MTKRNRVSRALLLTSHNVPSGAHWTSFHARLCLAQMEQQKTPGQEGARQGRLGPGLMRWVLLLGVTDELGYCAAASKRKAELIALLTQIALKGPAWLCYSCSCFCSSPLILSQMRYASQLSTKFSSALRPLEPVRMVFLTLYSGARLLWVSFSKVCSRRWTLEETRTHIRFHLSPGVSKWGLRVALDTESGTCVNPL